jgi:mRNA interferase MazF
MIRQTFSRGDILLADLVFSTAQGVKRRPVIVIADLLDDDILVAPVTSHPSRTEFDCPVKEWKETGLKLPSTIRVNKISTIAKTCVRAPLGKLRSSDSSDFERRLKQFFSSIVN